jgi:DNA-directed RNA polymerase specialized sigma24 family protein
MGDDGQADQVAPSAGRATDTALATPEALAAQDDDAESTIREGDYAAPPAEADAPHPGEPEPVSAGTQVVQDAPAPTRAQLRVDFGAHLEANYRRLVAQLYAITLDPAEAHAAVQDAYSRAWRTWATVSRSPDSVGWVRRVAVRSTIRSWRRLRLRSRRPVGPGPDTPTGAVLAALRGLPAPERRCVVLHHMAGAPVAEIAALEGVSVGTTAARLARAQQVVGDGLVGLVEYGGLDHLDHLDHLDDGDLDDGWDAGWQDEPVSGPFGEPTYDGYDGGTPERSDPRRPADDEEDQR